LIVLDTSVVFAIFDRNESRHQEAKSWYQGEKGPFATTPLVLVELDHLLHTRTAPAAVEAFYREIRSGALGVEWWPGLEVEAAGVAERYAEIDLGLVDASLVALAGRLETTRIATFDERHFRAVEPLSGGDSFALLPIDA